jgi:hypothetical protein
MLNRPPWDGIYCFEGSGLFPGVQLRNMNTLTARFDSTFTIMAQAGQVEHRCGCYLFEVAWGLRNDTEYGADPATQRMIRLAKAERVIRRLYRAIDELPSHERFPFSEPMEDLLATTVSTQERWVFLTEAYLPKAFKLIKKQDKIRNHSLEEYGFYGTQRTPRIHR